MSYRCERVSGVRGQLQSGNLPARGRQLNVTARAETSFNTLGLCTIQTLNPQRERTARHAEKVYTVRSWYIAGVTAVSIAQST